MYRIGLAVLTAIVWVLILTVGVFAQTSTPEPTPTVTPFPPGVYVDTEQLEVYQFDYTLQCDEWNFYQGPLYAFETENVLIGWAWERFMNPGGIKVQTRDTDFHAPLGDHSSVQNVMCKGYYLDYGLDCGNDVMPEVANQLVWGEYTAWSNDVQSVPISTTVYYGFETHQYDCPVGQASELIYVYPVYYGVDVPEPTPTTTQEVNECEWIEYPILYNVGETNYLTPPGGSELKYQSHYYDTDWWFSAGGVYTESYENVCYQFTDCWIPNNRGVDMGYTCEQSGVTNSDCFDNGDMFYRPAWCSTSYQGFEPGQELDEIELDQEGNGVGFGYTGEECLTINIFGFDLGAIDVLHVLSTMGIDVAEWGWLPSTWEVCFELYGFDNLSMGGLDFIPMVDALLAGFVIVIMGMLIRR